MIRKALAALALAVLSLSASAATYSFSYQGMGIYRDTHGQGTFTVQPASNGRPQTITGAAGTFSDPTDATYGATAMPITGVATPGALMDNPFSSDNLLNVGGFAASGSGIVLTGQRWAGNAYLPPQTAYVHIFAVRWTAGPPFTSVYRVETYLTPYHGCPGLLFPVPAVFSVQLVSP